LELGEEEEEEEAEAEGEGEESAERAKRRLIVSSFCSLIILIVLMNMLACS